MSNTIEEGRPQTSKKDNNTAGTISMSNSINQQNQYRLKTEVAGPNERQQLYPNRVNLNLNQETNGHQRGISTQQIIMEAKVEKGKIKLTPQ